MKAIILAAGVGKRLARAGDARPKCLLRVGGRSLLERTLAALDVAGVHEAVIVVGYRAERIRAEIGTRRAGVEVRYVHNPRYEQGAILSLWSARAELDTDVLVMDADVLFPVRLLQRLVRSPQPNCFLLDAGSVNTGEEQMLLTRNGRVETIVRGGSGDYDVIGESVGFLKVGRADAPLLGSILDDHVARGRHEVEHEDAFPDFLAQRRVGFERVDDLPWTEIDFPEDLETAKRDVLPAIDRLDAFDRSDTT